MKRQRTLHYTCLAFAGIFATHCHAGAEAAGPGRISPEAAVARAVNELLVDGDGILLRHPSYEVRFRDRGLTVVPRRGPEWRWTCTRVNGAAVSPVQPSRHEPLEVRYDRDILEERYLLKAATLEQCFVLTAPPSGDGADLVIEGTVSCQGTLERADAGWIWRNEEGVVTVANLHVFDAAGATLPAAMAVDAGTTRILVDGRALAAASYPVTIDPEIGANDFRVSDMGVDGDVTFDAQNCAVAYNATNNQYLVVWEGDDNSGTLWDGEFEIFGQRIDAATGAEIGANDFRISDMGTDGVPTADATSPAVAWNSANNEYLVVWSGDDATAGLVEGEYEIFGQRIAGPSGLEVGTNDFRLSDMGADGDPLFDASAPAVAYSPSANEYLVVWTGDDVTDEENEVYGQRVAGATGAAVGANDFRLSDMGPDGDSLFDAEAPAVAFGAVSGEYLVVWQGDDNTGLLVNGETEIFGQRVVSSTGAETGTNDFRISDMGVDGDINYDALSPAVAYASGENRFLVVWSGDDTIGILVEGEREIFGQLIDAGSGLEVGGNDLRMSDMGPDGDPLYDAEEPALAYNPTAHEFLVTWQGDDQGGGLSAGEVEIFGQRMNAATGLAVGANDFRLSAMGTPDNTLVGAARPVVAMRTSGTAEYMVTWHADQDTVTVDDEFEVFGQRVDGATGNQVGVDDSRLSDMGPDGDIDYDARQPSVAYNPDADEYLVVWEGDDNAVPLVDGETEIFAQRIHAVTGQELGTNDLRVSDMGPDGDPAWDAQKPAVAYNTTNHEYLVVWSGEDNLGILANGEFEIFGQRLSGTTGLEIGTNDFRITDLGPDGDAQFDAANPVVAYNPTSNEYLVVFEGDDQTVSLVEGEQEIFAQRISGATGAQVGTNDFRLSDMGPDGDPNYDAALPAVAWNALQNEYLVVWAGEDNTGLMVTGEWEIFGQLLSAAGVEIGTNDFRLSMAGADGDPAYDAYSPAVAYDSIDNQYLVVWEGEDTVGLLVDGENEIFGQRLSAGGLQLGTDDFRISDMGPDGDPLFDAQAPSVAYNRGANEYLVVWEGDDNTIPRVDGESEVWGQRLAAGSGLPVGDNDFLLSDVGLDGDAYRDGTDPVVVYSTVSDRFMVVWRADEEGGLFGPDEFEIFGQYYANATPAGVGGANPGDHLLLTVAPNPLVGQGRLRFALPGRGPVEVTWLDVAGRVVSSRVVAANSDGALDLAIDGADFDGGVYFVRVAQGSAVGTRKVIITR